MLEHSDKNQSRDVIYPVLKGTGRDVIYPVLKGSGFVKRFG